MNPKMWTAGLHVVKMAYGDISMRTHAAKIGATGVVMENGDVYLDVAAGHDDTGQYKREWATNPLYWEPLEPLTKDRRVLRRFRMQRRRQ